jgi:hypothetical protein
VHCSPTPSFIIIFFLNQCVVCKLNTCNYCSSCIHSTSFFKLLYWLIPLTLKKNWTLWPDLAFTNPISFTPSKLNPFNFTNWILWPSCIHKLSLYYMYSHGLTPLNVTNWILWPDLAFTNPIIFTPFKLNLFNSTNWILWPPWIHKYGLIPFSHKLNIVTVLYSQTQSVLLLWALSIQLPKLNIMTVLHSQIQSLLLPWSHSIQLYKLANVTVLHSQTQSLLLLWALKYLNWILWPFCIHKPILHSTSQTEYYDRFTFTNTDQYSLIQLNYINWILWPFAFTNPFSIQLHKLNIMTVLHSQALSLFLAPIIRAHSVHRSNVVTIQFCVSSQLQWNFDDSHPPILLVPLTPAIHTSLASVTAWLGCWCCCKVHLICSPTLSYTKNRWERC